MKIQNFLIGTDYEMSVVNRITKEPISVVNKMPGDKYDPADIGEGCGAQVDNVNAEMNTPPCSNREDFLKYIKYGINQVNEHYLYSQGLELCASSSQIYTDEQLNSEIAQTFGCDVSYNCYTMEAMPKPSARNKNMRTCGFHIHVGFPDNEEAEPTKVYNFLRYMDLYLGVPSILIDPDDRRRELYGKAGDCRIKIRKTNNQDFIVPEYRSIGGNLLATDESILWVYDQTIKAIEAYNNEIELPDGDYIQDIINNSNKEEAQKIVEQYNISLVKKITENVKA